MRRVIKFPLIMDNDVAIRTIEELRENFNLEKVIEYFLDGNLKVWLEQRNYIEELNKVESLEKDKEDVPVELCKIFDVDIKSNINILEIDERRKKVNILRKFSADESLEDKLEIIAFNQKELEEKLISYEALKKDNTLIKEIYLCGDEFTVSDKFKNVSYIGINNAKIILDGKNLFDAHSNKINFKNVKITSDKEVCLKIKDISKCEIDYKKVSIKKANEVKYCKVFSTNGWTSFIIDNTGEVWSFGQSANAVRAIPEFDAPILDIEIDSFTVVSVDENGKVYQWGSLPYLCSDIPKDLPRIRQVTTDGKIIIALDESGKIHWWGGWDSEKIFEGHKPYLNLPPHFIAMPKITSKIVQVTCKSGVVLALDENGKVYSWGHYSDKKVHEIPKKLPFIKKVVLSENGDSALALDKYGKIHFWGNESLGNSNIHNDLPIIKDISIVDTGIYGALDENGKVHILGDLRGNNYLEEVKRYQNLEYLFGVGGIDEYGRIYGEDAIGFLYTDEEKEKIKKIKVMIPRY